MSEYDGKQFVGIDLHRQRSVIVRQSDTGEQLSAVRIVNDPVALGLQIEKAGPNPEVVLEATYGWVRSEGAWVKVGGTVWRFDRCRGCSTRVSARWPVSASACVVGDRGVRSPG